MENLDRWTSAYVRMDERARRENLILMEEEARLYPAKTTPDLRLVVGSQGGGVGSDHLGCCPSGRKNFLPPALVGTTK